MIKLSYKLRKSNFASSTRNVQPIASYLWMSDIDMSARLKLALLHVYYQHYKFFGKTWKWTLHHGLASHQHTVLHVITTMVKTRSYHIAVKMVLILVWNMMLLTAYLILYSNGLFSLGTISKLFHFFKWYWSGLQSYYSYDVGYHDRI